MLARSFGFFVAGAAAAVNGGFAVDLAQVRFSTVADAAFKDAEVAALAHCGFGLPAFGDLQYAEAPAE